MAAELDGADDDAQGKQPPPPIICFNCGKGFASLEKCDLDLARSGHVTCKGCFFLAKSRGLYKRVSQATACVRFMLQPRDLSEAVEEGKLVMMSKDNPRGFGNKMKLYYEFQVAEMAERKFGSLDALANQMEMRTEARCRAAGGTIRDHAAADAVGDLSEGPAVGGEIVSELDDEFPDQREQLRHQVVETPAAAHGRSCSSSSSADHRLLDDAQPKPRGDDIVGSIPRKRTNRALLARQNGEMAPSGRKGQGGAKARKVAATLTSRKLREIGVPRIACEVKGAVREVEVFRCRQHTYGATETSEGLSRKTCAVCGDVLEWEEL